MKNLKRLFALFLVLTMCLSFMPTYAFAETEEEVLAGNEPEVQEEVSEEITEISDEPAGDGIPDVPAEITEEPEEKEEPAEEPADEEPADEAPVEPKAEAEEEEKTEVSFLSDDSATSNNCGDALTWTLDENGVLTISGTGDMGTDIPWASYAENITSVVIEDGVTSVADDVFSFLPNLTSVTLSGSVESIGERAFMECTQLTHIDIPEGVKTIGYCAFNYCCSLASAKIPSSVTSLGSGVFSSCLELTSITVSADNEYYSSIDGVLFNKAQTELIEYPCARSGAYLIPDGVTTIGDGAFGSCGKLTSITIPDGVTSIGDSAFAVCTGLTDVTIPASVTSIGQYAFILCDALETVYYGGAEEQWNAITIADGNDALSTATVYFNYTGADTEIIASGECGDNLTWTLDEDGVLTISGSGLMDDYTMDETAPWFANREQVKSVVFNGFVQSIGDYAFQFTGISGAFTIPGSVSKIGEGAFQSTRITSLSIMGRTDIAAYAFGACSSLTDIYYSGSSEMWSEMVSIDEEGNGYFLIAALHCTLDPTPISSLEELKALVEAADGGIVRAVYTGEGAFEFTEDFSGNVWLTADTLRVDSGVSVSLIGVEITTLDNEGSLSCYTATVHGFDHPNIGVLDVSGSVSCVFEVSNESDLMDAEWFQYGAREMGLPVDVVSISIVDDITLTEDRWFSSVIFVRNDSTLTVPAGITLGIESAAINPNLSGAFHVEDGSVQVYGNICNNTGIDVCADGAVALCGSGTYEGAGAIQVHCETEDDIQTMLPGIADMFAFELSGTDQYGLNIYTADNGLINPGDGTVTITDPAYFAEAVEMANNDEIYWITCEFEDTLELWDGLSFHDGMYVPNLLIPEGASVDIPAIIAENITVEGTLSADQVVFSGELIGRENIQYAQITKEFWPESISDMEAILAEAEASTDGIIRRINIIDTDFALSDDLVIPENVELFIINSSFTVPYGSTLTTNGILSVQTESSVIVEGELVNDGRVTVESGTLELRNDGAVSGNGLYGAVMTYSEEAFLAQFIGFDPAEVTMVSDYDGYYEFYYGESGICTDEYGNIIVSSPEYMEEAVEMGNSRGYFYNISCNFDTFTAWDGLTINGALNGNTIVIPEGAAVYADSVMAENLYVYGTLQTNQALYTNELTGAENIESWRICLYSDVHDVDGLYAALARSSELPEGVKNQINVYRLNISIDEDMVIPANVVLNLYDVIVTVNSGSTLTVDGEVMVFPQSTAASILVEGALVNNGEVSAQGGGTLELRNGGSVSGNGLYTADMPYSEEGFLERFIGFDPSRVSLEFTDSGYCGFHYIGAENLEKRLESATNLHWGDDASCCFRMPEDSLGQAMITIYKVRKKMLRLFVGEAIG